MNKNNINNIKKALTCLSNAYELSTNQKIILGLDPELNMLSKVIKKNLFNGFFLYSESTNSINSFCSLLGEYFNKSFFNDIISIFIYSINIF